MWYTSLLKVRVRATRHPQIAVKYSVLVAVQGYSSIQDIQVFKYSGYSSIQDIHCSLTLARSMCNGNS